ncbi:hypothetical protein M434DRAFT_37901 [Hypoxylon sp. CO27-5]|nr:hypothetical protein M434DRAFT_37901 [Hypoxylon sp. CO27-5]
MKLLSVIISCAFALCARADGGYVGKCRNRTIVEIDGHVGLRAYCETNSASARCSILDLDQCYMCSNGHISPSNMGHFSQQCAPAGCHLDGTTLECSCGRGSSSSGRQAPNSLETNDLIASDQGLLTCFDNKAVTPPDCAQRPILSRSGRIHVPFAYAYAVFFICIYMLWG